MVELVRRVSWQIGLARFTGLIFLLCSYGKRAGFQPRCSYYFVKSSGSFRAEEFYMGNSSLLEWGLRFFKRALHLIVLACLQINDNFLKKIHCASLKPVLGHRGHRIQTDQPPYTGSPFRPGQIVHTIALNITLKTYEIDTLIPL